MTNLGLPDTMMVADRIGNQEDAMDTYRPSLVVLGNAFGDIARLVLRFCGRLPNQWGDGATDALSRWYWLGSEDWTRDAW